MTIDSWQNGFFSISSGYKALQEDQTKQQHTTGNFPWANIWSLPIPPKVKNFMCKACKSILPTKKALQRKGVGVCRCYNLGEEDAIHALLRYPSRSRDCVIGIDDLLLESSDFKDWWGTLRQKREREKRPGWQCYFGLFRAVEAWWSRKKRNPSS